MTVSSTPSDARSQVLAGALAGLTADVIMHPADTIRTHHQSKSRPPTLRSLYRGFPIAAALSAPANAAYFCTYDRASSHLPAALAGALAELCGALLFVPMDVLKKRAMLAQPGYGSYRVLPRTVAAMLRTEGPRALYAGYAASVLTWAPFAAIYFGVYERAVVALSARAQLPPTLCDLAAGMTGGAVAALVTSPLDLVVTRVQTRFCGATSYRAVVTDLVLQDGMRPTTLFQGAGARVLWLAPSAGITICVFQNLKPRLDSYFLGAKGAAYRE